MKVHPFADRFPVLSKEQFEELVASIAENGQRQAIVLNADGAILDGRHRYRACELLGIEPRFETFADGDSDNQRAYIYDASVRGSRPKTVNVMAYALLHQKAEHGGDRRSAKFQESPTFLKHAPTELSWARAVIAEFGPDSTQVDYVMKGGSLIEMHQVALDRKRQRDEAQAYQDKLRRDLDALEAGGDLDADFEPPKDLPAIDLREVDPDLAARMASLESAYAAAKAKQQERREQEARAKEVERLKREAEAKIRELQQMVTQLGAELPPTIAPRIEDAGLDTAVRDLQQQQHYGEQIKAQHNFLGTMAAINERLEGLLANPIITGGWSPDSFFSAARRSAYRTIDIAQRIAQAYKPVAAGPRRLRGGVK